jgi:hypothetical protein
MSQTLTLPDELIQQLRRAADQRGVPIERLLSDYVDELNTSADAPSTDDEALLEACTRALLAGGDPPIPVDWASLRGVILSTSPEFGTLEDAMTALRHRPWTKDDPDAGA